MACPSRCARTLCANIPAISKAQARALGVKADAEGRCRIQPYGGSDLVLYGCVTVEIGIGSLSFLLQVQIVADPGFTILLPWQLVLATMRTIDVGRQAIEFVDSSIASIVTKIPTKHATQQIVSATLVGHPLAGEEHKSKHRPPKIPQIGALLAKHQQSIMSNSKAEDEDHDRQATPELPAPMKNAGIAANHVPDGWEGQLRFGKSFPAKDVEILVQHLHVGPAVLRITGTTVPPHTHLPRLDVPMGIQYPHRPQAQ